MHIKHIAKRIFFDLRHQFHWSFVPPLMIYFAAGLAGLTSIVGAFFVKDHLDLSAAFLAGLSFWAGLPWALKMMFGHLVDVIWRWKSALVILGAMMIAASFCIMIALIQFPDQFEKILPLGSFYVVSVILAALGLVLQDAVADAMSVEAVPVYDNKGKNLDETHIKSLHTTMQTFGRIALISGVVIVAIINIYLFEGVEKLDQYQKSNLYTQIYLLALIVPLVSVSGVILAYLMKLRTRRRCYDSGLKQPQIDLITSPTNPSTRLDSKYIIGGLVVFALILFIGITDLPYSQEIVFVGSMSIVIYLMMQLVAELDPIHQKTLFGTAVIIFVFRAVPLPGPGLTWFEIDELGFDQQFLSVLTLITSLLTLVGMIVLRPLMASKSISYIVVLLTLMAGLLSLPNIGLYYGIHHWTGSLTGGVVDARFIALLDTAIESPLGQIAMIPMLAWIARNAPDHLKATFFAVMASFTNLALSASSLLTKYINQIFVVTREVRDRQTDALITNANYSMLGILLLVVALLAVILPLITVFLVQRSRLEVSE